MNDPMYNEIRKYVQKQEKISVSYLQRKFRIGYHRASTIMDILEENKIVSERDKYGYRLVLQKIYVWNI